ncbi:MAG: CoA pyrophosphatase [Sphingomonas bacterium]|nr:CoA pyrophosphatase [Sphingomonas bacterium]
MSLIERIAAALAIISPVELLPGDLVEGSTAPLREAAVLVAITDRRSPGLVLTRRHDDLRDHGGQVAFPGGRLDHGEDARAAALREAWEELNLDPAHVRIIGEADHYRTITGFGVTPIVGVIPPDLTLTPNPREVADWFEAPLGFVLDPANHERKQTLYKGKIRSYYEIMWEGQRIWGATAAMLINLSRRVG